MLSRELPDFFGVCGVWNVIEQLAPCGKNLIEVDFDPFFLEKLKFPA